MAEEKDDSQEKSQEPTSRRLEKAKEEGLIRHIGASIKGPNVNQMTVDLCRKYIKTGRVDVFQVVYSILRQKLYDVILEAQNAGIGIVARTALESGFLSGNYRPGHTPSASYPRPPRKSKP